MKKFFTAIAASVITAMALSLTAYAQTTVEPLYPINGNKCGSVIVQSQIERDVFVTIEQNTPDGVYVYYDYVIPSDAKETTYEFIIEGRNDSDYTITIGVPEFAGSTVTQDYSENIVCSDVDEIVKEEIAGYSYKYIVAENEIDGFECQTITENEKNSDNIVINETKLLFSLSDFLAGDANLDSKVNVRDAAAIASSLANGTADSLSESADYNADGKINVRDAAAIASALANGEL